MISWSRYGPDALLFRFEGGAAASEQIRDALDDLIESPPEGFAEATPGFDAILVEFTEEPAALDEMAIRLTRRFSEAPSRQPNVTVHEIPVIYDGPDLQRLRAMHGLTEARIIELHSTPLYNVHCLGFTPGFPYLGPLDARLRTPRLDTPRPRIRAGSVAIGGSHTGIYSVDSPGGWNVIGRTDVALFNAGRIENSSDPAEIFLMRAGDKVKFIPAT